MGAEPPKPATPSDPRGAGRWGPLLCRMLFLLWVLQLFWLAWELREEGLDLGRRVLSQAGGEAVRQEDPFYRWLANLQKVIPPEAAYLFLDNYEAGREIEARYHLFPRRHALLGPDAPPSLFFHTLGRQGVTYLLVRDDRRLPGSGLKAALAVGAATPLEGPGPGLVYRLDPSRLKGGFYD